MKFLCFVFEPEVTAVVISFAVLSIMVDVPESLIEAPRMTLLIAAEAVIEFDIEKEFPGHTVVGEIVKLFIVAVGVEAGVQLMPKT